MDNHRASHSAPSPNIDLRRKLTALESQLAAANEEKENLQDEISVSQADLDHMRKQLVEFTAARDTALQDCRTLRGQLQTQTREHEHKVQSQSLSYEQDITNLEAELCSVQAKLTQPNPNHTLQSNKLHASVAN